MEAASSLSPRAARYALLATILGSLVLVGGSLGDLFGEVRMFTLGVILFGVASTLCAVAPDSTTLIVLRGIQGTERGAAIGTWTAWSGISTVIGPLLGGWLIGFASWRVIFLLNVPLALFTVALVRMHVPQSIRPGLLSHSGSTCSRRPSASQSPSPRRSPR